ncbi:MAG: rhodanese-like domain-containing protein [Proteobacteria bacterium]|nr:rhodanese-like domain-containing protein [Pseudomonadota bacterium]
MVHRVWICMMLACGVIFWGCGSDDDVKTDKQTQQTGQNTPGDDNHQDPTTPEEDETSNPPTPIPEVIDHTADWLGPLEPEAALEYMKETYSQGLVIINVVPEEYKRDEAFTGSMYIPYTELEARKEEIPAEKPVILHCNRGKASELAYPILQECRKDIPVLSYIAGEPLYDEFNAWVDEQKE